MKKLFLVVVLAAFAAAGIGMLTAAEPKDVMTYTSKTGTVTFNHKNHTSRSGANKCATCHHTDKPDGVGAKKCGTCHGAADAVKDGKKVASMKNAAHKMCKDCHVKSKAPKAPAKCGECHIKAK